MVNVSRTQFKKELRRKVWQRLWKIVRRSPSERVLAENLAKLLTPSEIAILEKRVAIHILLAEGMSYREIGRAIDASSDTINFVKHRLVRMPRTPRRYDPLYPPRERRRRVFPTTTGPDRWRWLDDLNR